MTAPSPLPLPVLRKLLNEATALPWEVEEDWIWGASSGGGAFGELVLRDEACLLPEDAALIVAAVNHLPFLLELVERQAAAIEAVHELAEQCVDLGNLSISGHAVGASIRAALAMHLSGITPTTEEKSTDER